MSESFWSGRRVLLTGHTGFKGSWLSLWLQALGAKVTGFSLAPPSDPSLYELARVSEDMDSIDGDVRDLDAVSDAVTRSRPEVILHLAAQPIVRRSYSAPVATYATNVMGTVHLLEAARRSLRTRVVVNVTSDKCYENREWPWAYREPEPMGGHDPYSSSKGCSELITAAYRSSFFADPDGPRLASARAGNVIGGGDWGEDRLVPDLMRGALAERPAVVRNPGAVRPWQHVLNPLSGYLVLAQALWDVPGHAGPWNFGPEERDARPVGWVVERLAELWGTGLRPAESADVAPPHEAAHLKVDSAKAHAELGWAPTWPLEDALRAVVGWYWELRSEEDMRAVSLAQIEAFAAGQPPG